MQTLALTSEEAESGEETSFKLYRVKPNFLIFKTVLKKYLGNNAMTTTGPIICKEPNRHSNSVRGFANKTL